MWKNSSIFLTLGKIKMYSIRINTRGQRTHMDLGTLVISSSLSRAQKGYKNGNIGHYFIEL